MQRHAVRYMATVLLSKGAAYTLKTTEWNIWHTRLQGYGGGYV